MKFKKNRTCYNDVKSTNLEKLVVGVGWAILQHIYPVN